MGRQEREKARSLKNSCMQQAHGFRKSSGKTDRYLLDGNDESQKLISNRKTIAINLEVYSQQKFPSQIKVILNYFQADYENS